MAWKPLVMLFVASTWLGCDDAPEAAVKPPDNSTPPAAAAVRSLVLDPAKARVDVGAGVTFHAAAYDAANNFIVRPRLTWSSSDATVATVDTAGVARGISAGYVAITASGGTASAFSTLHVEVNGQYPSVVVIAPQVMSLTACNSLQLGARTLPDIGDVRFVWRTTDSLVARVDNAGLLRGVAPGSTTITALWAPDTSRLATRSVDVGPCS